MKRLILLLLIISIAIFGLLSIQSLTIAENPPSAQAKAHFTKATGPIDMLKEAFQRAVDKVKDMIFKTGEEEDIAERRTKLEQQKAEEVKATKAAEESTQDR